MKLADVKRWAKTNRRPLALGGAALVVALLALRSRRNRDDGSLIMQPQYAGAELTAAGGADGGTGAALTQMSDQFTSALAAQSDQFNATLAAMIRSQESTTSQIQTSVADLMAQTTQQGTNFIDYMRETTASQVARNNDALKRAADAAKAAEKAAKDAAAAAKKAAAAPKPAAPAAKPKATPTAKAPAPKTTTYTVKAGDNLSTIAARNGISLSKLLANNPQFKANPNLIHPGDKVKL